ncbi:MAG TPA: glycosyltransferase family 4 protein [Acidimicrobiales bacterium]|nr:glycosyltransferase family 4 protein [Acidimicrobiales bacterium]
MAHVLVTNDFPPKVGGIQSYLWELWRRLPPDRVTVLTTSHPDAAAFDAAQPFPVHRWPARALLPVPPLAREVRRVATEAGAALAVFDPALPVGLLGPRLGIPYGVVLHGAEVTVPGRLPVTRQLLRRVLRGAVSVVAAGGYPAAEATRVAGAPLPLQVVPPGVDVDRFRPLDPDEKHRARAAAGLPVDGRVVVGVSRLVPRKGFDVLIAAASLLAPLHPDLTVALVGAGRDRARLERLVASTGAPVRLLGFVADADMPGLLACADVFAMPCRSRWGGLEQEGFGIVFLEAAACGVPGVAGASGGSHEAVASGETGFVVRRPADPVAVAAALARLLDDPELCRAMGGAARRRAEERFSYDRLAADLAGHLAALP